MAAITNTFNKFFFYTGLVCVIWFGSKFHSWATDTNPSITEIPSTPNRIKTKAEIIREQDAANSGTLIAFFLMIATFGGCYIYVKVKEGKRDEPARVMGHVKEKPKALPIVRESERSLVQKYCKDDGEYMNVLDLSDLIIQFHDYKVLHLTLIEKYKNDLNFAQLDLLNKTSKKIKNDELGHKVRNLQKFWTQSKVAKARDKHETRRFYKMILPPLPLKTA